MALATAAPAAAAGAGGEGSTEVNSFSGAFQTRVPIGVPGFRGLEPKLALQYSSPGGNGPLGVGWALAGVSSIERTAVGHGAPRYDGSDVFMLDGNDLIAGCGTFGGTHCTRVQSYQRITWDGGNNRWFVWGKDGTRSTYAALLTTAKGTHRWALTEVRDTKNNVAAYGYFCGGGDCYLDNVSYNGVLVKLYWQPGRSDPVTYAIGGQNACYSTCYETCYASTCCDGTYDKYGNCVATCDKYGNCTQGAYPCSPYDCNPYNCNPTPCGVGGIAATTYLLKSIDVTVGGARARAYKLGYGGSGSTGRSLLQSVQQFGSNASVDGSGTVSGTSALPAQTMGYAAAAANPFGNTWLWTPAAGSGLAQTCYGSFCGYPNQKLLTGDFNGDGRTDFILYNTEGTYRSLFTATGNPSAPFTSTFLWTPTAGSGLGQTCYNSYCQSAGQGFVTGDFNGDGKTDFILYNPDGTHRGLFTATGNPSAPFALTWLWTPAPGSGLGQTCYTGYCQSANQGFVTGDFNGDGKTDLIIYNPDGTWRGLLLASGNPGAPFALTWLWTPTAGSGLGQTCYAGYCQSADQGFVTGDFNGDGKTDFILHNPDGTWRGLFLATGNPGAPFSLTMLWRPNRGQPGCYQDYCGSSNQTFLPGDFNGDGKTDFIIYNSDGTHRGLFTATGNPEAPFTNTWLWTPATGSGLGQTCYLGYCQSANQEFVTGDFNGDGKTDFILYNPDGTWRGLFLATGNPGAPFSLRMLWTPAAGSALGQTCYNSYCQSAGQGFVPGDFNGDGKTDFILYNPDGSYRGLFTAAGAAPDTLTTLANGLGGTTTVSYTPSSSWSNTYLPAGVVLQTAAAVVTSDGRGDTQTTTYSYQGARWRDATAADPVREFLGYRRATTTLGATGAYSETYYWQRAGTIAKPEVVYKRRPGGAIMSFDKLMFCENGNPDPALSCGATWSGPPYVSLATQAWSYECNGNGVVDANHNYVSGCRRVVATYEWDVYANLTREYQYGDYDVGGDERTAARAFVPNTTAYVVGLPQYEYMYAGLGTGGAVLSMTHFYYDDAGPTWAWGVAPTEGKLTRKASWLDATGGWPSTTFGYDAWGNETSITDTLGRTATKTYDGTYHLLTTSTTNELGHVVQSGWDALGRLTRTTDPDGNVTTHTYDVFGRGLLTTRPDGSQVKVEHLNYGDLNNQRIRTSTLLPGGQWVFDDSYFDGVGRAYRTWSSTGVIADTIYGPNGKLWKQSLPYQAGETVRYDVRTYDDLGRELSVQTPDGATVSRTYANGYATATDAIGNARTTWFDGYGRLVAVREVIGGVNRDTVFSYDLLGRRTKSVDPLGYQTVATYDSLGRVLQKSDPDQGLWQYRYDDLGRITKETDALGRATGLGYDLLGRVTRRTYHNGTYDSYTFDEAGRGAAKGRLTTAVSASGVTTRAWYDGLGRRTRYEEVIDGATYALSHTYDVAGRLATATYPDGEVVTHGYGTSGLATGKLVSVSGSVAGTIVSAIGYTTKGQVASVTYGNGVTTTNGFDPVGERVASIQIGSLATISYGYDGNGRVASLSSGQLGLTNWTYGYDSIGRLTRATNTADGTKSETFSYDAGGRMLSKSSVGSYTYGDGAHAHAVTTAGANTYTYDAAGNMVSGAGRSFTYDYDHRPLSITYGGSTTTFVYDALGVRVKKSGASGAVVYVGGVQEKRGTAVTKYYFAGGFRVAKRDANGNQYLHADHLGSTRLVTNQSGAEVKRYEYAAYGAVIGQSGSLPDSHRYAGHEADDETGLAFFQARYYDATLGRFVQPDSFVPNANNPQSLDLYAYANNSPINYVDPSGHAPALVAVGLMSATTAATVTAIGLTVGTLVNIAAVVIGTALTFTNNPILQTIGMVMAGMGGAAMFGGPSLFGGAAWGPTATGGLVALAQSPISPLDPTVKKVIGWAYTIAGFVENLRLVEGGKQANGLAKGFGLSWGTPSGTMSRAAALWHLGKSELLTTAAGWALAYWLSGSEIGRYASAFASRFIMAATQGTAGPLAALGATFDLAYTIKYPDGRVYDLRDGGPGEESFTFYYHTGFESPGYALGRQHIRVGGRGGYWELGDTRAGFFGPGLGWGGWIGTQKITVIMTTAQANAFVGAMEDAAAAGGRYQGYHADSHTYVSAALQFATGKSAADLHINPGLIHW